MMIKPKYSKSFGIQVNRVAENQWDSDPNSALTLIPHKKNAANRQPGMFCRVQRTVSLALMAPAWRATSRPLTNSAKVGMLRIW